jgi:hypothetical protein
MHNKVFVKNVLSLVPITLTYTFEFWNVLCYNLLQIWSKVHVQHDKLYFYHRNFHFSTLIVKCYHLLVKLLDWGEDGHRSEQEIAALRAAFAQEVVVWHKLEHPNVTKVIVVRRSPPPFLSNFLG